MVKLVIHKRVIAISCIFALLFGFWLTYRWYTSSPWFVMRRAVQAIYDEDWETLCRLTDEEELKRLNITPQAVANIFHEVLESNRLPPLVTVRLVEPPMPDQMTWDLVLKGDPLNQRHYYYMSVQVLYTKRGWRLLLSHLLLDVCAWKQFRTGSKNDCYNLLMRHGIKGLRREDGGFDIFSKEGTEW